MARPKTLTEEQRKIARAQRQKKYREKIYAKARACDMYEKAFTKVTRRLWYSALANILLLIACILWRIF